MYIEEADLLFIHIPKIAGTSINKFLMESWGLDHNSDKDRQKVLLDPVLVGHRTAYEQLEYFGKEKFESLVSFAICRNPWDRVFSMYRYRNINSTDFRTWLFAVLPQFRTGVMWPEIYYKISLPQVEYIWGDHDEQIVDTVLRFENLEQEFSQFCTLNFDIDENNVRDFMPRVNVAETESKHGKYKSSYKDYYTSDMIDKVYKLYHEDVDYFGYEF